jgi:hypothetical protein
MCQQRASEQTLPPTFILEQNFQRYLPLRVFHGVFAGVILGPCLLGAVRVAARNNWRAVSLWRTRVRVKLASGRGGGDGAGIVPARHRFRVHLITCKQHNQVTVSSGQSHFRIAI